MSEIFPILRRISRDDVINLNTSTRKVGLRVILVQILNISSLSVSLRTTRFNIQNFYMVLALR